MARFFSVAATVALAAVAVFAIDHRRDKPRYGFNADAVPCLVRSVAGGPVQRRVLSDGRVAYEASNDKVRVGFAIGDAAHDDRAVLPIASPYVNSRRVPHGTAYASGTDGDAAARAALAVGLEAEGLGAPGRRSSALTEGGSPPGPSRCTSRSSRNDARKTVRATPAQTALLAVPDVGDDSTRVDVLTHGYVVGWSTTTGTAIAAVPEASRGLHRTEALALLPSLTTASSSSTLGRVAAGLLMAPAPSLQAGEDGLAVPLGSRNGHVFVALPRSAAAASAPAVTFNPKQANPYDLADDVYDSPTSIAAVLSTLLDVTAAP